MLRDKEECFMKILLVEDDRSLGETLQKWLEMDGYVVDWVMDGVSAQNVLIDTYDSVLLDRGLPGASGDIVLKKLREKGESIPIIMITAQDSIADRIEGLDLGADDYLVKPFDLEELSARIRALSRRSARKLQTLFEHRDVVLDPTTKSVTHNGESISLTAKEYAVLHTLMQNPSQIFTREQLEDKLYAWGNEVESNAIEVHIHHLRKKLGNDFIKTRRNLGYTLGSE